MTTTLRSALTDPTPKGVKRPGTIAESNKHRIGVDLCDKYLGLKLEGCLTGEGDDLVVLVEHYEGEWVVRVWSDYTNADPTHRIVVKKAPPEVLEK